MRNAVTRLDPRASGAISPEVPPAVDALPIRPVVSPEKTHVLLERVIAVHEKTFAEVREGKTYLAERGITDAGLFSCHRVGYANGKLVEILPRGGKFREELTTIGVLLPDGTERFKDCVVFPVYDADGNLITLCGEKIDHGEHGQDGGGLPSSDREPAIGNRRFFLPDRPTGIWNAATIKAHAHVILVKSVIDALSVMMAGHRNVVSIHGADGPGDADIRTLKTQGVQAVTLLLDGDGTGGKATAEARRKLEFAGMTVTTKALPAGDDPNSYLVRHGARELAWFLTSDATAPDGTDPEGHNTATDSAPARAPGRPEADGRTIASTSSTPHATEPVRAGNEKSPVNGAHSLTFGLRRYEIRGLERSPRRLRLTLRVEFAGRLHVDTLDLYQARARRNLAFDLCRAFDETPETIEGDIEKLIRHCETMPEQAGPDAFEPARPAEPAMTAAERQEAEAFGRSPTLLDDILADCQACGLIGESNNALLLYVAMTSRKRDAPLSVLILSSSGAGKTALQDTVCAFCPPEDLVKLTALSGKALFYKDRLSLKNKVLALEEGAGAEQASYAIRNLISAGELVTESTIKDLATGRLTTMENRVEGPTAVFLTTTNPEMDPETRSRFWVTSVDESREQTRRILSFQRERQLCDEPHEAPDIEAILKKHRNFQRLLKPLAVRNPYAAQLTYGDDRLQGRRDQPKYLNLIKAIAFLRQMRKEVLREERDGSAVACVKADLDDIRLANRLTHDILGHSLDELSRPSRDLLMLLQEMVNAAGKRMKEKAPDCDPSRAVPPFSRREIREFAGWNNNRVHRYLKELLDLEHVIQVSGRNGMLCRYRLAWEGQGKDGARFVLGLTDPDHLAQAPVHP